MATKKPIKAKTQKPVTRPLTDKRVMTASKTPMNGPMKVKKGKC